MAIEFKKATKKQSRLRMAILGPTGSGKTMTALRVAKGMGGRIAFIDSERGSASLYSHVVDFDVLELESYSPERYIEAIHAAEKAGYDVCVIDSLSHAWAGKDGLLEFVDNKKAQSRNQFDSFGPWRDATPLQNRMVDTILGSRMHIIATMRTKMDYVLEKNEQGKNVPRKVGLQPIQRDSIEYEFTLVGDMDQDHRLLMTKSRIAELADAVILKPGEELGERLMAWLEEGEAMVEKPAPEPTQEERAEWVREAHAQLQEWGLKFSDIPEVMSIDAPDIKNKVFAFGAKHEDPFKALMECARKVMPKQEVPA